MAEVRVGLKLAPQFTTVDDLLVRAEPYVANGFTELIVYFRGGNAEADAEILATEALPRLHDLGS